MITKPKARQLANTVLAVLELMTEGQGQVTISVFDAGAGGGFQSGRVYVMLERDGLSLNQKRFSRAEFLSLITAVLWRYVDE